MKKIAWFFLTLLLSFVLFNISFSNSSSSTNLISITIEKKNLFYKPIIIAKAELEKNNEGKIFKTKIDKLIPQLSNQKLTDVYKLMQKIDTNNPKYLKHKYILRYLYAKIWLEIHQREYFIRWVTDNYHNYYEDSTSHSRDLDRMENLKNLNSAIEMIYMQTWEYPNTLDELKKEYVPFHWKVFPSDPKQWEKNDECEYWYHYKVLNNNYWKNQWYTISVCLENKKDWTYILSKWIE